jgi:dTDP-4-dehydrorhamnose reductase
MRVLIIGAQGMLGSDLLKEWETDELIPASSRDADIRVAEQVHSLLARTRPDWTVLTAAYTDVDGSEDNPENAFAVCASGTENVARAAKEVGSRLFFVSTDYLFDGTSTRPYEPDDPITPLNLYGQSKAAAKRRSANTIETGASHARPGFLAPLVLVFRRKFFVPPRRGRNSQLSPIRWDLPPSHATWRG